MSVGRICTREVHLADPDEPVAAAARRMGEQAVGSLVVLDDDRRPAGVVTDRDLVLRVLAAGRDPCTTTVAEVMTRRPRVLSEETPIEQALSLMRGLAVRRVPVVGADGRLVGLVTLDDVLSLLAEELAAAGEVVTRQAPRRRLLDELLGASGAPS